MHRRSIATTLTLAAVLATPLAIHAGCAALGYPAAVIYGDTKTVIVEPEYEGLAGQSVAVLVDASDAILLEHPLAQLEVAAAVTEKIAADVAVERILDAEQVVEFQNNNIYWNTMPYSSLARRLGVSRLVLIDLTAYRLHEPGNVAIWRGTVAGQLSVVEADGERPNDRVYQQVVACRYPPDSALGTIRGDDATIRRGMLDMLALQVSGRFHEFETEVAR